jgi:DNA-binding beta-propeller fold protein YncE
MNGFVVAVAADSEVNKIYVATYAYPNNNVQVLNGTSNTIEKTILLPSGFVPGGGLAVNTVTRRVYVVVGSTIRVIENDTLLEEPAAALSDLPTRLAFDPINNRLYAVAGDGISKPKGVIFLDGTSLSVQGFIPLGSGGSTGSAGARDVAVDASNGTVYVTLDSAKRIDAFNAVTAPAGCGLGANAACNRLAAIDTFPTFTAENFSGIADRIAVNPVKNLVYYTHFRYCATQACFMGPLGYFTGLGNSPGHVLIGSEAAGLAVNPTNDRAYVTLPSGADLSIVDTLTAAEIETVSVGYSTELTVNPATKLIYLASGNNVVVVEDLAATETPLLER